MENVHDEIEFFTSLVKNISQQFGMKCEVVLHDYTKSYDSTIVLIENGYVTGRKPGGPPSDLFYKNFKDGEHKEIGTYMNTTDNGRVFKSSTTLIRNSKGRVIGSLCINFDVTEFIIAGNLINNISSYNSSESNSEVFNKDVNEMLENSLVECQNMIGIPPGLMTKEDKLRALRFLDDKGIFLITKSGKRVCDFFGISKFTLYNYLDEIRKENTKELEQDNEDF